MVRAAAAAGLGVLHAASFAPPVGAWWLQILSLSGLFLLARAGRAGGLLAVFCFGIGWFAAGLSWLHTSMHVYGGMPSAMAAAAVLAFSIYLALFPAFALWLAARLVARPRDTAAAHGDARVNSQGDARVNAHGDARLDAHGNAPDLRAHLCGALALAGAWCLSELGRGWLLTGFPWLSIGYAHVDGPLGGLAPWVGVYGVGAGAALVSALLASAIDTVHRRPRPVLRAGWLLVAGALPLAAGSALGRLELTAPVGEPVSVRLLQGNVPQQLKFDSGRALQAMDDYVRLAESGNARLIVLPETAWTVPWSATPPALSARLDAHARRTGASIAIGMPLPESTPRDTPPSRLTNSVALLEPRHTRQSQDMGGTDTLAAVARYDKQHLVPFGEFIPFGFAWFVQLMRIPLGEFGRGAAMQPAFEIDGQRFAFNVCYEDLFGEQIAAQVRSPQGASVLVNVSNIAWFGNSAALPQHLAIARMRTLETGRPMLRATNTGVTASIDHRGRVLAVLPVHTQAALDATVRGTAGATPYVRFGNLLPLALAALLLALARIASPRRMRWRR